VVFFSAADGPVLPLSFSLGPDRGHAHDGGARNRRIAARMARTIGPVTASSASWKVMARAWRTTQANALLRVGRDLLDGTRGATVRAFRAVRPHNSLDMGEGRFFVVEVRAAQDAHELSP